MNPADPADTGLVTLPSAHGATETVERLKGLLAQKGIEVFAHIDHAAGATSVGLPLRPTQVLIFGNPRAGTPLLVASPRVGLDLPLKALAWEDADGAVMVSLNAPEYLEARHELPHELVANVAGARALIEAAAAA